MADQRGMSIAAMLCSHLCRTFPTDGGL